MRVFHRHMRALHYCNRGLRSWLESRLGLDWQDFLDHGADADQLAATGDAMALAAVELARAEAEGGR